MSHTGRSHNHAPIQHDLPNGKRLLAPGVRPAECRAEAARPPVRPHVGSDAQGLKDRAGRGRFRGASASGTAVRDAIAPAPTRRTFPRRTVSSRSALSRRERVVYWALTLLWVVVVARFWTWWLRPEHFGALGLYLATTVPMAYLTTVLPSFYWFFVGRMRRPVHMEPAPDRRVAMITLCVPSHETLDVIAAQLRALDAGALPPRQLGPG